MAEKEQPLQLEERTISGRGLIKWEPDNAYRRFWLNIQVIRPPSTNFINKNINPDRSDYARITWMRDGMVLREDRLQFEFQSYVWEDDAVGYLVKYLICILGSIQEQITTIQEALSIPVGEGEPIFVVPIQDQFDSIKIVCRPDTAITAQFWGLKYDVACPDAEATPQPPPPPPMEPTYPPGTPLEDTDNPVSPPYDEPDDSGDTVPLPGDVDPTPPPVGDPCTLYNVNVTVIPFEGEALNLSFQLFGEIDGAGIGGSGAFVFINARGGPSSIDPPGSEECLPAIVPCAVFGSTEPAYSSVTITEISPAV